MKSRKKNYNHKHIELSILDGRNGFKVFTKDLMWKELPGSGRMGVRVFTNIKLCSLLQREAQPELLNFRGKCTDLRDFMSITISTQGHEVHNEGGIHIQGGICRRWFGKAVPGESRRATCILQKVKRNPTRGMAHWVLSLYWKFCRIPLSPLQTLAFHSMIFHTICNSLNYTTLLVVILCDTQLYLAAVHNGTTQLRARREKPGVCSDFSWKSVEFGAIQ